MFWIWSVVGQTFWNGLDNPDLAPIRLRIEFWFEIRNKVGQIVQENDPTIVYVAKSKTKTHFL